MLVVRRSYTALLVLFLGPWLLETPDAVGVQDRDCVFNIRDIKATVTATDWFLAKDMVPPSKTAPERHPSGTLKAGGSLKLDSRRTSNKVFAEFSMLFVVQRETGPLQVVVSFPQILKSGIAGPVWDATINLPPVSLKVEEVRGQLRAVLQRVEGSTLDTDPNDTLTAHLSVMGEGIPPSATDTASSGKTLVLAKKPSSDPTVFEGKSEITILDPDCVK